jgi:hypothetical protein
VLAGELIVDRLLSDHSCVYVSDNEPVREFSAGVQGVDLIIMQFPKQNIDSGAKQTRDFKAGAKAVVWVERGGCGGSGPPSFGSVLRRLPVVTTT